MSRYVIRFMKKVLGGNGREVEICQQWFDTDAPSRDDAVEIAKRQFCVKENVHDWRVHADRISAVEADFPS